MNRFEQGKVYKLVSDQAAEVYIGSTIRTLSIRLAGHRSTHRSYTKGQPGVHYCTSFEVLRYDDSRIELIELYPCTSKAALRAREQMHIDAAPCVNQLRAFRSAEYKKEAKQRHYEANKTLLQVRALEYYYDHREAVLQRLNGAYRAAPMVTCECGGRPYRALHAAGHERSKGHQRYLLRRNDGLQPVALEVC